MRVILSSNIPRFHHVAAALEDAGWLTKYICGPLPNRINTGLVRVLSESYAERLAGRNLVGVPDSKVRQIWLAEAVQKAIPACRLGTREQANLANNFLFDQIASRSITRCDLFCFVSSVGLYSAQKAKREGAIVVCCERTEHPDYQRNLLREEYESLGLPFSPPGLSHDHRIKAEHDVSDYIVVVSEWAKKGFVASGVDPDKIVVIQHGCDLASFHPMNIPPDGRFRVVYAGQIIPRKGVRYLVDAFKALAAPDSELQLIGGISPELAHYVSEQAASQRNIHALGHVPQLRLAEHYNRASVFVMPTLADAGPLVTFQAMACGLPVITTDSSGFADVVENGVDGFIVPSRDSNAILEKLQLLYRDKALLRRMSEAAWAKAQQYTWESHGERMIAVFRRMANVAASAV